MKLPLTISFVLCLTQAVIARPLSYSFKYKYSTIEDESTSKDTTGSIEELIQMMFINGMRMEGIYNNGASYLSIYFDTSAILNSASGSAANKGTSSISADADAHLLYKNGLVTKIERNDTSWFSLGENMPYHKSGKGKTINNWYCEEYIPSVASYGHMSIWVSKDIPASIAPGILPGLEYGIVEIDNHRLQMKLLLEQYGKTNKAVPIFASKSTPKDSFEYLDAYK